MKLILVTLAIVAVVASAPVEKEKESIKILRSEFDQRPDGGYVYSFESEDGISRVENGEIKEAFDEENKPHQVVVVRGSWTYTNDQGKLETITYYADETGFHAEGDSIPKPVEAAARR